MRDVILGFKYEDDTDTRKKTQKRSTKPNRQTTHVVLIPEPGKNTRMHFCCSPIDQSVYVFLFCSVLMVSETLSMQNDTSLGGPGRFAQKVFSAEALSHTSARGRRCASYAESIKLCDVAFGQHEPPSTKSLCSPTCNSTLQTRSITLEFDGINSSCTQTTLV